jgi:hypothetical protein
MEAITLHPKNKTQLSLLKKLATEMGMAFETKEVKESTYNSEFVDSILQSREDSKNGKGVKIPLEDLWK